MVLRCKCLSLQRLPSTSQAQNASDPVSTSCNQASKYIHVSLYIKLSCIRKWFTIYSTDLQESPVVTHLIAAWEIPGLITYLDGHCDTDSLWHELCTHYQNILWKFIYNYLSIHKHTHMFNGLFSRTTCVSWHQKGKPFWTLLKQEMMGWHWHQLDHMQIICTTFQTDNHASTSSLNFMGWCSSWRPINSVKALKITQKINQLM